MCLHLYDMYDISNSTVTKLLLKLVLWPARRIYGQYPDKIAKSVVPIQRTDFPASGIRILQADIMMTKPQFHAFPNLFFTPILLFPSPQSHPRLPSFNPRRAHSARAAKFQGRATMHIIAHHSSPISLLRESKERERE